MYGKKMISMYQGNKNSVEDFSKGNMTPLKFCNDFSRRTNCATIGINSNMRRKLCSSDDRRDS